MLGLSWNVENKIIAASDRWIYQVWYHKDAKNSIPHPIPEKRKYRPQDSKVIKATGIRFGVRGRLELIGHQARSGYLMVWTQNDGIILDAKLV